MMNNIVIKVDIKTGLKTTKNNIIFLVYTSCLELFFTFVELIIIKRIF